MIEITQKSDQEATAGSVVILNLGSWPPPLTSRQVVLVITYWEKIAVSVIVVFECWQIV